MTEHSDSGNPAGEKSAHPPDQDTTAGETPALLSGWHWRGYLPHLKAKGRTYFVTFRLADTLPGNVLEAYRLERDDIVKRARSMGRTLLKDEQKRLNELYSERIESYLDARHGKCWLRQPEIGGIVADALAHSEGRRYALHAWVVMPNHVRVVATPLGDHTLSGILQSWKSSTAHQARKVAQASRLQIPKGEAFWQRESYDHLVRDEADFARVCQYTIENPVKAGLCSRPEDWPYLGPTQPTWPEKP
jgi:REP element-mobilizing transposase RayT